MPHSVLIRLSHQPDDPISWASFDYHGALLESEVQTSFSTIPTINRSVVVLIPSTDIVLTSVDIPSKQWQRVVQAVPYALEEQLAEDIDNLHFALGKRDAMGNIAVAIIAHKQMGTYLQQLTTVNLTPTVLIPDILAVPQPEQGWGILPIDNIVLVRTGAQAGFAIEPPCLKTALSMALLEHKTDLPQQLVIFTDTHTPSLLPDLQELEIPIIEEVHETNRFAWLVQGIARNNWLNLLQGVYRPHNKIVNLWRPWRLTAMLLILLGGLHIAKQILAYQQLVQQRQILTAQIEKIYRETFPQAHKVVNPRVQMEQQLQQLRTQHNPQTSTDHFLYWLNQLSTPLQHTPGFNLKQIDYQPGQFDLYLEIDNLQALEHLKQRLSRLGFTAEIQSATSRSQVVESRLRITRSPR
ncbi:general secretion pathway protein L [Thioploca ingrica]|uniref:Type II secretion system protein L n=1 Tax=Thioploca ingrica TaxID=40754 RepID=A0A090AFT6_9GAMM|nr:general secretion pathway protein L [Thioploca ingrica]